MLKQCAALFLLLATMASTFSKAVIVVDFYANQDSIAATLCVNKDKPGLKCHGRCQLCKRLAHDENQDKTNPERRPETKNEVVFVEEPGHFDAAVVAIELTTHYPLMPGQATVDRTSAIFHPPGC